MRPPGWIDRGVRKPTSISATIVLFDGRRLPILITNVSKEGCRVECEEMLPIGVTVQLEIDGVVTNADVRWALPGCGGLRLHET